MEIKIIFIVVVGLSSSIAWDNIKPNNQQINLANIQRWRDLFTSRQRIPITSDGSIRDAQNSFTMLERAPLGTDVQADDSISFDEYFPNRELDSSLPYGIQNVRDLSGRSAREPQIPPRRAIFQSICSSKRKLVFLNSDRDSKYEYRPPHYDEVICDHPYISSESDLRLTNEVCDQLGFSCIQLNRTIFLTRRLLTSDCWETFSEVIPAGCECMKPHTYG